MSEAAPSQHIESEEQITAALREQGESEEQIALLLPTLARLQEWHAPTPAGHETQRLLAVLTQMHPPHARPIAASRPITLERNPASILGQLLNIARLQISLLRPSFWLASALITLLGLLVVLPTEAGQNQVELQVFVLRASGPLLAGVGIASIFRSARLGVLEIEMSCPISPLRLTLARLVVVLAYDLLLGLVMSLAFWLQAAWTQQADATAAKLTALTLHWLAPLLLVAGLCLALSARLRPETAVIIAYAGWMSLLALTIVEQETVGNLLASSELAIAAVGLALLAVGLLRMRPIPAPFLSRM
ncbi:MAG TPA: hypothetical protein VEW94_09765 [Chloroflexia bacterium]|nr:hypothetical protein [Chloroflexia bacterium]